MVLRTLATVGVFVALMLVGGRRLFPWLLWQVARTGSRELFTLCVIAAAVGIAYASAAFFGVSYALGAFFAGMVLRESDLSHRAADESLPFRDAFAVLFFVSVGMLFDPAMLWREPGRVLTVVAVIVLGKALVAVAIVLLFRYPLNTALTVAAGLAQVGEFSFILAALGVSLGVLPPEGQGLLLAGALLSIAVNPLVFGAIEPVQRWVRSRSQAARLLEQSDDPLAQLPATFDAQHLTSHVVLVGFGRIGRRIGEALMAKGIRIVVAEQNRDLVEGLRARGVGAVCGDASVPAVLIQAHIARASTLVLAVPDVVPAREMIVIARTLNPDIFCIVRSHGDDEANLLRQERADRVLNADQELAVAMTRDIMERLQASADRRSSAEGATVAPRLDHA
ncbi:MAG: cation:proton antiporter [Gemmatimonadaceae bacterium]